MCDVKKNKTDEKLLAILSGAMKGRPGAASFAIWRHGDILASGAIGAESRDLFCIGSISKIYCAAAIMILVDRGLVDLDAPVCRYLPRFRMADERYKQITVRMALNHSSGLPGTCVRLGMTREPISQELWEDCSYDYFAHSTLKADPGAVSVYCNDGFTLAEFVVKEVSGLSLPEFVRENILSKIGAERTCYTHETPPGRIVRMDGQPEIINFLGAGGVAADMADLCRFGSLFLPGRASGILSEAAYREMRQPQGRSLTDDRAALGYGLGWDSVRANPAAIHFGPNMMGIFPAGSLYDFGENALSKAGTSTQVKSLLIVLPKYDAVCAMAVTLDTGLSRDELLPELFAAAMEDEGIFIRRENSPGTDRLCPADPDLGGYYLSGPKLLECRVEGSSAAVYACIGEMRIPLIEHVDHIGGGVFSFNGLEVCRFIRGSDRNYLLTVMEGSGLGGVAEGIPASGKSCEAWQKRVGSTWLCVNGDSRDMAIEDNGAFASIGAVPGIENLFTCNVFSPDAHEVSATPFFGTDDCRGSMFMNGSFMSSRDSGEPIIKVTGGREELYYSGMRYIRLEDVPPIREGNCTVSGDRALAFRLTEDCEIRVTSGDGAVFLYDAQHARTDKAEKSGFALLMGSAGTCFSVRFSS